jgi:hypothetical protein
VPGWKKQLQSAHFHLILSVSRPQRLLICCSREQIRLVEKWAYLRAEWSECIIQWYNSRITWRMYSLCRCAGDDLSQKNLRYAQVAYSWPTMMTQIKKEMRYVMVYFVISHVFCILCLLYRRLTILIKRLLNYFFHHLLLICRANGSMSEMFDCLKLY